MADNTTTYTANVDVNVNGGEQLQETGEKAEEAAEGFVKLQLQIRKTQKELQEAAAAGDKVKFKQLKAQLDDLEDGLEKVQFQSKQFEDQLASLPGPAGQAGGAIKGVGDTFKLMLANPVVAFIAAIAGALILMKKALSSTAEGQQTLNRLSQAFSKILGPILATVEAVAIPTFELFADILEFVAEGFNKFAKFLGVSQAKIKEATLSVDEVQQDANDKEKKRQEELTKKSKEEQQKREENAKKAAEAKKKREEKAAADAQKREEERVKNLDAANKVLTEAYISTLAARDQEIFKLGQQHNERMLALEKAGIKDKTSVAEQYRIELEAINKKYDDEEAKKVEEKKKEQADKDKEAAEKAKEAADKAREDKLLGVETELEFDAQTFDQKRALVQEKEAVLLSDNTLTENQRVAIRKQTAAQIKEIDMAELDAKAEVQNAYLDLAGQFGSLLQQIAGKNKKVAIAGIIIEQAAAIGKIVANTAVANAKAVATFPITAGQPWVTINTISAALGIAGTIAGAAKAISQINSSDNASAPATGGVPRASVAAPVAPTAGGVPQIQTQTGGGANPTAQIAQTIAQSSGRPVKAYVVAQDVSSAQAFDRRTNVAATL